MPDIRAFRGIRYDMAQVGAMSDVVAPPYDVIDAALQDRLYDASPYNIIRLELNREEPGDDAEQNRYTRAARFLKDWQRQGVLREDPHPSLYVYHQTFEVEGIPYTRKGFLARVRLEDFGRGKIYPHEQTLSGPKADRLALFEATRFNLSPIFGLYRDPSAEVLRAVEAGMTDRTPLEATDHLGVVNRLWPVLDPRAHTAVQGLMGPRPIFIADGHHRYETGLRFRDDRAAAGDLDRPRRPGQLLHDDARRHERPRPGDPPHPPARLGLPRPDLRGPGRTARPRVRRERCRPRATRAARAAWEAIESDGGQDWLGFGTVADGRWMTARLRSDAKMDALAPDHSPDWRSLGVSILHELVLKDAARPARDRVMPLRPPPRRGRARRGGRGLRPGLPRAPRGHGSRRVDRLEPGEDAPQEHLLLPQAPQRARPEPPELSPDEESARNRESPPAFVERIDGARSGLSARAP